MDQRSARRRRFGQGIAASGARHVSRLLRDLGRTVRTLPGLDRGRQSGADADHAERLARASRLQSAYELQVKAASHPFGIECVVFSKDRPMQLDLLLRSWRRFVTPLCGVVVIYHASTPRYAAAYRKLSDRCEIENVGFVAQSDERFRAILLDVLSAVTAPRVMFLVDDMVITNRIDLSDFVDFDSAVCVPSLRLGRNLRRCYTRDVHQPLPPLRDRGSFIHWCWEQGVADWGYPLSLDGHILSTAEIRALAEVIDFGGPNSFESSLQAFHPHFVSRQGVGYATSRVVNIPCNRVQSEAENRFGCVHQDELLALWESGARIELEPLAGFVNESAHQEIDFTFSTGAR